MKSSILVKCNQCKTKQKIEGFWKILDSDVVDVNVYDHIIGLYKKCACGKKMSIYGSGYEYSIESLIEDIEVDATIGCTLID